jgi:hypothetical protein
MIYYLKSAFEPNLRRGPAGLTVHVACVAQPAGVLAQQTRGRASRSGAKTRPVKPNSTRQESNPTRTR